MSGRGRPVVGIVGNSYLINDQYPRAGRGHDEHLRGGAGCRTACP